VPEETESAPGAGIGKDRFRPGQIRIWPLKRTPLVVEKHLMVLDTCCVLNVPLSAWVDTSSNKDTGYVEFMPTLPEL
jgi:hypothetical protein